MGRPMQFHCPPPRGYGDPKNSFGVRERTRLRECQADGEGEVSAWGDGHGEGRPQPFAPGEPVQAS